MIVFTGELGQYCSVAGGGSQQASRKATPAPPAGSGAEAGQPGTQSGRRSPSRAAVEEGTCRSLVPDRNTTHRQALLLVTLCRVTQQTKYWNRAFVYVPKTL